MIQINAWRGDGTAADLIPVEAFDPGASADARVVWIDLVGDDTDEHRGFLQERLGLPRLAVDDALRLRHPPKYEDLGDGWHLLLMRGFDVGSASIKFGTIQLAVFWRDNLLVTRHVKPSASVVALNESLQDGSVEADRAWTLLYTLLRKLLDLYLPITLKIEARLEEIEEMLLKRPSDRLLGELMEFSSQLKRLRRIGAYHEKCLDSMRTHRVAPGGAGAAQLTDLFEHAERLHSLASLLYETTSDLMDGYLSVSAHRLNNVMRVLTVVTVLFVPLTFVAGIYGMNFEYMPELKYRWGYFVVLGVMAVMVAGLLALFRRRGWL
ncbi:magnesium transporter CorA family protein [Luteimonas vadosa]|uniref:Magnesium/cobalt transporter CorA n=1 Tax=Luteimonas vadosa TaxID=1165507 RepID=A0ABP9DZY2_9GAMM